MSRVLKTLVAIAVVLWMHTGAEAVTHPSTRNGFMIGFGLGGGSLGSDGLTSREGSVTANFRIGYAVRPDLALHLESNAWVKTFDEETVGFDGNVPILGDITFTASNAVAALTFYPPRTGLFLRGGVGLGRMNTKREASGFEASDSENGVAVLAAVGYEWRLTKMFALAPQLEFIYQEFDTLGSSTLFAGGLGCNWYW